MEKPKDTGVVKGHARRACLGGALLVTLGSGLQAQSFNAPPILFEPGQGETPLVVAYEPASDLPRLIRFTTVTEAQSGEAIAPRAGFPAPSIILGRVPAGTEESYGIDRLMPETVAQFAFPYNDIASRNALRSSDPEMFRALVSQGHIDPPEDRVAVALQEELQRMNCYRSSIDGAWGAGSRRAAAEYFRTSGVNDNGLGATATAALFRSIVLGGDTTCVVAAQTGTQTRPASTGNRRPASTGSSGGSGGSGGTSSGSTGGSSGSSGPSISGGGVGVFR